MVKGGAENAEVRREEALKLEVQEFKSAKVKEFESLRVQEHQTQGARVGREVAAIPPLRAAKCAALRSG
jgi:hypothetical protein